MGGEKGKILFHFLCAFVWLCQCADKVVFDYANTVRLQVVSGVGCNQEIQEPWAGRDARRHERDPGQQPQRKEAKTLSLSLKRRPHHLTIN